MRGNPFTEWYRAGTASGRIIIVDSSKEGVRYL